MSNQGAGVDGLLKTLHQSPIPQSGTIQQHDHGTEAMQGAGGHH
jgi:hypothetical protein